MVIRQVIKNDHIFYEVLHLKFFTIYQLKLHYDHENLIKEELIFYEINMLILKNLFIYYYIKKIITCCIKCFFSIF